MAPTVVSGALLWVDICAGILSAGVSWLYLPWEEQLLEQRNSVRRTKTNSCASECITMNVLAHTPSRFLLVQSLSPSVTFIVFFRRPMRTDTNLWGNANSVSSLNLLLSLVFSLLVLGLFPVCKIRIEGWRLIGRFDLSVKAAQCWLCHREVVTSEAWANTPDRKLAQRVSLLTLSERGQRRVLDVASHEAWCRGSCLTLEALRKPWNKQNRDVHRTGLAIFLPET